MWTSSRQARPAGRLPSCSVPSATRQHRMACARARLAPSAAARQRRTRRPPASAGPPSAAPAAGASPAHGRRERRRRGARWSSTARNCGRTHSPPSFAAGEPLTVPTVSVTLPLWVVQMRLSPKSLTAAVKRRLLAAAVSSTCGEAESCSCIGLAGSTAVLAGLQLSCAGASRAGQAELSRPAVGPQRARTLLPLRSPWMMPASCSMDMPPVGGQSIGSCSTQCVGQGTACRPA